MKMPFLLSVGPYKSSPYLLLANYRHISRLNLDGSQMEVLWLYDYSYALDFDYRYVCFWCPHIIDLCYATLGRNNIVLPTFNLTLGYNKLYASTEDRQHYPRVTVVNIVQPFDITFDRQSLYWSDSSSRRILSVSAESVNSVSYLSPTFSYSPYGIKVISESRQPEGKLLV